MTGRHLEEVMTIPGNEFAIKRARESILSNNSTAFVGAGPSIELYCDWNQLLGMLANRAVERGLADEADREYWLNSSEDLLESANGIRSSLGDRIFGATMREFFEPKRTKDGNAFTELHEKIVRMSFKGIVTSNYDICFSAARSHVFPGENHGAPATWADVDAISDWHDNSIFKKETKPLLHAHGIYNRHESILLGGLDYPKAYVNTPYRGLFDKWWSQDKLTIIGTSLRDPWLRFLASQIIAQLRAPGASDLNHTAIIGLHDEVYTRAMRRNFQNSFDADPIFYRVVDGRHDALFDLLDFLSK